MTTATTRRDSSLRQIQKRVPADVLAQAQGRCCLIMLPAVGSARETTVHFTIRPVVNFSLRVRDPSEARLRTAAATAQLERLFASIRSGPIEITHKQAVTLSGEIYRLVVERFEMNPGVPEDWEAWKAFHWGAMEGRIPEPPTISWQEIMNERKAALGRFGVSHGPLLLDEIERLPPGNNARSLETRFGLLTSWVLDRHGFNITPESRLEVLRQVAKAALDAGWRMKRASQGDYSPDPKALRFPPIETLSQPTGMGLTELFDHWRKENSPEGSTITTWKTVIIRLQAHLGHGNLAQISQQDLNQWKDALVARGLEAQTINGTYLACVRALFAHGVRNGFLLQNVAIGVRMKQKRRAGAGMLPYEDSEVAALLKLAAKQSIPFRRWLPLLAACSGARIGELAQLWAERIREIDGIPAMELRPAEDGGSMKNDASERIVPLHPVVIEAGFLDFVRERQSGPLFYGRPSGRGLRRPSNSRTIERSPTAGAEGQGLRHASKSATNRLAGWIRKQPGFDNERKDPSHALRHWWKSTASRVGISDSRANAIQGHKTQGEAARYRHFDLSSLAQDVARIPVPWRPEK